MKTYIYVDGFNLYYGAVRKTPYKWLNILALCQLLLPTDEISAIKYFTARVSGRTDDTDQPKRQQVFLRALRTIPNLTIIEGHFLTKKRWMPVADCPDHLQSYVKVIRTEEKGSDVNLATHLLHDGFKREYELAVLITNDSDLAEAIRIVREELGLKVGILNPHQTPSAVLLRHADFIKQIRAGVLEACQFPDVMTDAKGDFYKPAEW